MASKKEMSIKQDHLPSADAQTLHLPISESINVMFQGSHEPTQPRQVYDNSGAAFNPLSARRTVNLAYGDVVQPYYETYAQLPNDNYHSDYHHELAPDGHSRFTPKGELVQQRHDGNFLQQAATHHSTILPSNRRTVSTETLLLSPQPQSASSIGNVPLPSERIGHEYPEPNHQSKYPIPVKPRIATTYWNDEKTLCYQMEARGVLVSRREDTNYINGTKLLNVAGMSRGKRDGILKTEKDRYVVRAGAMSLKGVWIPYERAKEIARNEGVDNFLFPLFVEDIKEFYLTKGSQLKSDCAPTDSYDSFINQRFLGP